ncbi:MAG: LLM class flavin-dependent oxidoreductase [Pseudomonadales bacterium]|jgi:alkanesulfonate monooxygenase SsuD/methylene tetrahydromethanopterin reductase-like flavin-dependent oxidoreductase (luciferase family)|nr:LLM class flavin-dependent oxidoreductase [Pseudomonadales bacterium]MDP7357413.1 LLM class flavin-dependent oxidoreductase [Pseudomonadales bacterium]MDP7595515.1 LLM class flavin-dependent oxidoreductase [Pseudomonadales bacterium]HJN52467.1 LLM class flavin-dependent oxidoreductase [Pseudomonadales bacterium]|tara:strand:- start:8219 stop:9220 length:1002 start_codon:yes stop_codon:yes gene_type:complete
MGLGILAGAGQDWRVSLEKVQIAESLGYELVATGEAWAQSSIPWMTILATNTERIQIGTSILNVFSRSPGLIAQEFAALDSLSGGRMVCGLGSSGHRVIEHFHGVPFDRPLRRIREYVEIFDQLIAGEKLNYDGRIFNLKRGFTLDYNRPRSKIPVYIAAITAKSIRQTGEIADGIYPIHWPRERFASLRAELDEAATAAGHAAGRVIIAPFTNVYVTGDGDDEAQWRAARQPLFHYINRMGDFYWNMLASNGYESEVSASRAAWAADRNVEGAMQAISTDMVRSIQVIGSLESVTEQLGERAALGADLQMLQMPGGTPAEAGKRLEALIKGL